jgi:ribosome recycling factor
MSGEAILNKFTEQCKGTVVTFKKELQKVRSGRASTGLVETVMVDYYGAKTQLSHLAQLSTPEARLILVQVHDSAAVPAVEKALKSSGLGLNPQREGNSLRVNIPVLTEETRREIIRHLHKIAEDMRVSVRNHRREANDAVRDGEKNGTVPKDEAKKALDRVQKQTDTAIQEIDKLLQAKEAEVKEV